MNTEGLEAIVSEMEAIMGEGKIHNDKMSLALTKLAQWNKERYIEFPDSKKRRVVLCPFHQEKTPSCCIDPEEMTFSCFGCGAKGRVSDEGVMTRSPMESKIEF